MKYITYNIQYMSGTPRDLKAIQPTCEYMDTFMDMDPDMCSPEYVSRLAILMPDYIQKRCVYKYCKTLICPGCIAI